MRDLLLSTAERGVSFLETAEQRRVAAVADRAELLRRLANPLPEHPEPADEVLAKFAQDIEPGLVASSSSRYFGFVIGGATPISLAADWLTSTWDQNAQVYATSPAAAIVEEIVAGWVKELLRLPASSSVGFVTGGQMANFTALSAARNAVLGKAGWDLEADGLFGAPPIAVFMSETAHATVHSALRMMGIGNRSIHAIPADQQGRIQPKLLEAALADHDGPTIVSLQAGNVNTGSFEPFDRIADMAGRHNAWIHVDGAFGLWAAVSPRLRHLVEGMERADSWSVDAHKWLNVPHDSGLVIVKDPAWHRSLKTARCAYAGPACEDHRDGSAWSPENSRRARAFVLYAVLRSLGRSGIQSMIERSCEMARMFAERASNLPHAHILNDVSLNQVLLRFSPPNVEDLDRFHAAVAQAVQRQGRCWLGTTLWSGNTVLRLSFSNWQTDPDAVQEVIECLADAVALSMKAN